MKIFLSFLLIGISVSTFASDKLELSVLTGPVPVSVTAPASLTNLQSNTYSKWVGCGFNVDWGDSSEQPKDYDPKKCSWHLKHTYKKPGTYKVKASIFHPNPDDSHTTDWSGENSVIVK